MGTNNILEKRYYKPSATFELYDPEYDIWYNSNMDILRDPIEYNEESEGYTPFGDE